MSRTQKLMVAMAAVACLMLPAASFGDFINVRPPLNNADLSSLQGTFDSITTNGNVDVGQQSGHALFGPTAGSGAVATMVIELAGLGQGHSFGIYQAGNHGNSVTVFTDQATDPEAEIKFMADGSVYVNKVHAGDGFRGVFGFYLSSGTDTWYTEDSLNSGAARALVYQGDSDNPPATLAIAGGWPGAFTSTDWLFGWEVGDVSSSATPDYNDFVVFVTDVQAVVPAPGAMILGALGLGLVGWTKRRRA